MPHFSSVLENERDDFKDGLIALLTVKFGTRFVHTDVRWRNIGKYQDKDCELFPVLFDLYDVVEYNAEVHHLYCTIQCSI